MSERNKIGVTIITLNEEKDLPKCIESLGFADEIVVVDSGSSDKTAEVAKKLGAKVYIEPWRGYGAQKNRAMELCDADWVLNVDADEVITPELRDEILSEIKNSSQDSAFAISRKTFYWGKWIRHGGWYPNYVTRLARKGHARWTEPNVHEELVSNQGVRRLKNSMEHYTFQGLSDQIATNLRYARQGAHDLYQKGARPSLLKLLLKPLSKFFETYIIKKGFLDGLAGFVISVNAAHSMFLKYAFLYEIHLKEANGV
ncbi:MAG: glycosyltransferase family 2 protein [Bacteriovoracia bacterium]